MPSDYVPNATHLSIAPGRVNLLGEHVDYNDGMVLPAAIDRSVKLSARARTDRLVTLRAEDINETVTFSLDALSCQGRRAGCGPALLGRCTRRRWPGPCRKKGLATSGIQACLYLQCADWRRPELVRRGRSCLCGPVAGRWAGGQPSRMDLARLCQRAENAYVGVNCGLMDQFASANGVEGHALYFDTRSLAFRPVPLPAGTVIVIADLGVRRTLTTSAYNDRRAACEQAVALLKPHLPGMTALRDVTPADFARLSHYLPELVARRAQHIVEECARMEEAVHGVGSRRRGCLWPLDAGRARLAARSVSGQLPRTGCAGGNAPRICRVVWRASDRGRLWRLHGEPGGRTARPKASSPALKQAYEDNDPAKAEVYLCHASQGVHVAALKVCLYDPAIPDFWFTL